MKSGRQDGRQPHPGGRSRSTAAPVARSGPKLRTVTASAGSPSLGISLKLVIARSARARSTFVVSTTLVAGPFAGVTVTVRCATRGAPTAPTTRGTATIVMRMRVPCGIVPRSQWTLYAVELYEHVPRLVCTAVTGIVAGMSVLESSVTKLAFSVPSFVTVTKYLTSLVSRTGSGSSVTVTVSGETALAACSARGCFVGRPLLSGTFTDACCGTSHCSCGGDVGGGASPQASEYGVLVIADGGAARGAASRVRREEEIAFALPVSRPIPAHSEAANSSRSPFLREILLHDPGRRVTRIPGNVSRRFA